MVKLEKVKAKISLYKVEIDQKLYVVKNLQTGEFFLFNERSLFLWNLMDGSREVKDIVQDYENRFGQLDLQEFNRFLGLLKEKKLVIASDDIPVIKKSKLSRRLLLIRLPLLKNTAKIVSPINKYVWGSPKRITIFEAILLLFSVSGLFIVVSNYDKIFVKPQVQYYTNSPILNLVLFLAFLIPMSWVHEMSHALLSVHYGVQPGEIGLMFFNFLPSFYVDISDSWFCSKKARIFITLAGPISSLFIGFLVAILWYFFSPHECLLTTFIYFCILSFILNLNPLLPFDGYYILMDLLEVTDLRSEFRTMLLGHGPFKMNIKRIMAYASISCIWSVYVLSLMIHWITRIYTEGIFIMRGLIEGWIIGSYLNLSRLVALLYIAMTSCLLLISSLHNLYMMYVNPLLVKLFKCVSRKA